MSIVLLILIFSIFIGLVRMLYSDGKGAVKDYNLKFATRNAVEMLLVVILIGLILFSERY